MKIENLDFSPFLLTDDIYPVHYLIQHHVLELKQIVFDLANQSILQGDPSPSYQ